MTRAWTLAAALLCPLALAITGDAYAQAGKKPGAKPDPKAQAQPQWKKGGGKLDPKMAEAKRLFDEGAKAYGEGSYEGAIEAWLMSFEISKRELICENIANAYERLGKPKEARDYLTRWRAVAPQDERETLDARIKNLEERIAREEAEEKQRQAEREKREREKREKEKVEKEKAEKDKRERLEREAEKKKQDDARKKREDEKRRAEEEKAKREAEKAREAAMAARQSELDRFRLAIQQKIKGKANIPDTVTGKPSVIVRIRILPGGEVLDMSIERSSGNRVYDAAIERAVRSASPLPVPPADSELFPQFRDLRLNIEHDR